MGNQGGISKLKGSMQSYGAEAGGSQSMPGVVEPDKGFELKPGSNGKSSGAALPIYQGPGDGPSLGMPQSDIGPSDDNDSDESKIIEPDKGFVKEPVARGG